ncbi:MAG: hypothetical protein ACTXOO_03445 [Sodalis sp. (in: enterobacteria)]
MMVKRNKLYRCPDSRLARTQRGRHNAGRSAHPFYTDPGCAPISSTLRNPCKTFSIQLIVQPVMLAMLSLWERRKNILECKFESCLRFVPVDNIDKLNCPVGLWRKNITVPHCIGVLALPAPTAGHGSLR